MKRKFLLLLLAAGISLAGCSVAPASSSGVDLSGIKIALSADQTSVLVGEKLQIVAEAEGRSLVWTSSDAGVATVEAGLVTGISAGQAVITAALAENLSVRSTFTVRVSAVASDPFDETVKKLVLTTPPTKTAFIQGTNFAVDGLVVTLQTTSASGEEKSEVITDYSINPAVGTLLANVGAFTATISYPGADSLTFDYTVASAPLDDSLKDALTQLEDADEYKVQTSGYVNLQSGTTQFADTQTFVRNAYYYESDSASYGYAYQSRRLGSEDNPLSSHARGVFQYTLGSDGAVVPGSYVTHGTFSQFINKQKGIHVFNDIFNPETAPRRSFDGSFKIDDSDVNEKLMTYIGLPGNGSYVSSVTAKVLSETSLEVDMKLASSLGEFKFTVTDIGTATLPAITAYLDDSKGGVDTYADVALVKEALATDTYAMDLGTVTVGSGILSMTYQVGTAYFTPNYVYYDYTDAYLNYLNSTAEAGTAKSTDRGYLVKGDETYAFTVESKDDKDVLTLGEKNDSSLSDLVTYFSAADAFDDDGLDLFAAIQLNNQDAYMVSEVSAVEDFGELIGASSSYTGLGVALTDIVKDAEGKKVTGVDLVYVFQYGGNAYMISSALTEMGTAKVQVVEDYLASK